jgi:hypothetical protein
MGLKEEAIKIYRDNEEASSKKRAAEKEDSVSRKISGMGNRLQKIFGRNDATGIVLKPREDQYWPECFFSLEGTEFEYHLDNESVHFPVHCGKCTGVVSFHIRDLEDFGKALCWAEAHNCNPPKQHVPPPPPKTVTYRVDSIEQRLLECLGDFVREEIIAREGN